MKRINKNSISLAGEFAVLSQLSLKGYDANMTLGRTKDVDILVYDPRKTKSFQLEVKASLTNDPGRPSKSKVFGTVVSSWVMNKKHESIRKSTLFYCFVSILMGTKGSITFKFYIVPSRVVARYVAKEHEHWLREKKKEGKKVKANDIRLFRFGLIGENYPKVATPTAEKYEDNWDFAD